MSETTTLSATDETWNRDAEVFGQLLARDIESGDIQLPGFPPVLLRVQQVLAEEDADLHDIAESVTLEPELAMLVLRIANSAALNTSGVQIRDLTLAVQRVGTQSLRSAVIALVVRQLRSSDKLRMLRDRLGGLWRRGVIVGSLARVLARKTGVASADSGLLIGLLHVVGRLYVMARLNDLPHLFEQDGVPEKVLERWSDVVTGALLRKWEVPHDLCVAVEKYQSNWDLEPQGPADLGDVLLVSQLLADLMPPSRADYLDQMQLAQVCLLHEPMLVRLQLDRQACSDAIHAALEDVLQLRVLFGV